MNLNKPFRGSAAIAAGLTTRRRLRGPTFEELGRDTYVAAGVELDHMDRIVAAALEVPGAVVGGWSAVTFLGVDAAPTGAPIELVVGPRRVRPRPGMLLRQDVLGERELRHLDGIRVTNPDRTAADLARSVDHVEAVVAVDALAHRFRFDPERLLTYPAPRDNPRGSRRLERVVADADARAESPPETRARLILFASDLPRPVPQFAVRDVLGHFVGRVDFGWPGLEFALEYQGDQHRTDQETWRRDVLRLAELAAAGWLVLPLTALDLRDPSALVARVRAALRARARERGVA
ncbi:hypothetical protein ACR9E3_18650 [Actinomycetospora sp. C-140]